MNKKLFDIKYVKSELNVLCETEEEAKEFLNLANKFRYKWNSGESYKKNNKWNELKEKTIYNIRYGKIGNKNYEMGTIVKYKKISEEEQKFIDLYLGRKKVVHCENEKLAREFLRKANEFGYTWFDGSSYIKGNEYDEYGYETCYSLYEGLFGSYNYYKKSKFDIVKYKGDEINNG